MKRLLLVVLLLCVSASAQMWPVPGPGAPTVATPPAGSISFVNSANIGASSTLSYAVTGTGNLLVLDIGCTTSTATVTSVSDNSGDTGWTLATSRAHTGTYSNSAFIYYLPNTAHTGSRTITATMSNCGTQVLAVHEYSGVALTSPLDATGGSDGSGTSWSAGTLTNAASGEMVHALFNQHGILGTLTPAANYTSRVSVASSSISRVTMDRVSAAISESVSATVSSGGDWVGVSASFKSQ